MEAIKPPMMSPAAPQAVAFTLLACIVACWAAAIQRVLFP
jgi:hypothetical protein